MHTNLAQPYLGQFVVGQFTIDNAQLYYITGSEDLRAMRQNLGMPMSSTPATKHANRR